MTVQLSLFSIGEEMFEAMLADLRAAEKFIFWNFISSMKGRCGDSVLESGRKLRRALANRSTMISAAWLLCRATYSVIQKMGIEAYKLTRWDSANDGIL